MLPSLHQFIPPEGDRSNDAILLAFLGYVEARGLVLYPAQEAAILDLFDEKNVILNTPTGSGKSLVASALHFKSLVQGRRSVYTCPIKALVNEKWMALCREFGPENVGLSTGDATVNREAPILCCTAEILSNIALREGAEADVQDVVADEFHYYADKERGVAWQVPLLTLSRSRFLLMSATLGDTSFFERELTQLNGRRTVTVRSSDRPVPLEFSYVETPLAQTLEGLAAEGKSPVYVVHFTQLEAAQSAQDFTSINISTKEEKAAIQEALEGFAWSSPYGPDLRRWLRHGIGLHHAGLLPKYRVLVEQLAQRNLLKIICGTDTLGVGINVPIRTVLFTKLCKYDGQKTAILSARDFHQIAGRAGRKGFDDLGWVVVQAPEHIIENKKLEEKKAQGGKKFVKRKPPERNFVPWDKQTFERLIASTPERLTSQFQVSHGMLLNVLSRVGDGCLAMRELIRRSHEPIKEKANHRRRGWQLFRSLLELKVIEILPGAGGSSQIRVNVELQDDFSLDQALSLYLVDTVPLLDPASVSYTLDLITLVESILENPEVILRRQLDRIKKDAIAAMKEAGLDYDQRMQELEKLEHPKPLREFVYTTFNEFAARHPWVGRENIRPKSIAREMFEEYMSFGDYVRRYELQRSEGLLLRHLSSVHKILCQTVPDGVKTDAVRELELYLGAMIRQVDSSLLDEWEKMRDPGFERPAASGEMRPPGAEEAARDVTRDEKTFLSAVRDRIFTILRSVESGDLERALQGLGFPDDPEGAPWSVERLREAADAYYASHERIRLDPAARRLDNTKRMVSQDRSVWTIQQLLVDPEELNDWQIELEVDLEASRAAGAPALRLARVAPVR